ncbi:MAG: hypothetical protein ACI8UO_005235 [Verrucomicrobiales bacterium]|jgi:hypothetical protein
MEDEVENCRGAVEDPVSEAGAIKTQAAVPDCKVVYELTPFRTVEQRQD